MSIREFYIKLSVLLKLIFKVTNWYIPALQYFNMCKKEDLIRFRDGTKCIIRNKSDATAFFEVFFLKTNTNANNFTIKESDVIIDIGAHVGFFTIYAAKQASKGVVYSFEPSKSSFRNLQYNIQINNLKNVIAENCGVLKTSGTATLFVDENDPIGNSMFRKSKRIKHEIVTTVSLQDIIVKYQLEKIDLLKLDCEGAEFEIILNLTHDTLKKIVKIAVEVHGVENYSADDLSKFLISNNFMVEHKHPSFSITDLSMLYAINKDHLNN